jgi:hypothetical protein
MERTRTTWLLIFIIIQIAMIDLPAVYADNETKKGSIGLSASLQGSQLDYIVPIWINDRIVAQPSLRAINLEQSMSDLGIGFGIRYNINGENVITYLGFRGGALILFPKGGKGIADYVTGPFFGGEYFFVDKFSAGVEAQLNVSISDDDSYRFGDPGKANLNTATSVYVTFYFK